MVKLIFYNIEYLEGTDGKKVSYLEFWKRLVHPDGLEDRIASALRKFDPDIVAFAEVGGKNFIEGDYLEKIKKDLGMKHQIVRKKYDFRGKFNLLKDVPLLNKQANAIMSKRRICDVKTVYLHEGMKRTVIEAEIDCGKKIDLILVHLSLGKETRKKQIDELAGLVNEIRRPVILAGDFNTFEGEREIKRLLESASLKHEFKVHGGRIFTFPSCHPRRRFDYILTSKGIKVKKYDVLKMPFSDHLPVMINFEIK